MKWKSILAMLAILFLGFVMGFITSGHLAKKRFDKMRHRGIEKGMGEHLYRRLEVGDQQKETMAPIIQKYAKQLKDQHEAFHQNRVAIYDSLEMDLIPHLDEAQKTHLTKMMERMKKPPHERKMRRRGKKRGK